MTLFITFKNSFSAKMQLSSADCVLAPAEHIPALIKSGVVAKCEALETYVDAGSIYEASALAEELSRLVLPSGERLAKSVTYKGYELWWIHYNKLYLSACLPYTQYKRLLEFAARFDAVYVESPPYPLLFSVYLSAHNVKLLNGRDVNRSLQRISFGVIVQSLLTLFMLPLLVLKRAPVMVFTSDLFDGSNDYDFRMRFIYEELRARKIRFVEWIRSLEPWRVVMGHAAKRRRPVVYSEAVRHVGHVLDIVTGGSRRIRRRLGVDCLTNSSDPNVRFKYQLAAQSLCDSGADVWSIRLMSAPLWLSGVKVAYVTATADRNFHAVLACKILKIPIIGILHGVASKDYNVYDFLPGYDGKNRLSVDFYGVWSDWWRDYYITHSKAYAPDQLVVSGLMRPLLKKNEYIKKIDKSGKTKVLFVSEQLAVPKEVLPYLQALLNRNDIDVYFTFRPYRDGFEVWLRQHHPEILVNIPEDHILRSGISEAVKHCDVVVGAHSTAVLEALFIPKPIVLFNTSKWGDYFSLEGFHKQHSFFVKSPNELVEAIQGGADVPSEILLELQRRFFGDTYQNGSKWVVDQIENILAQ